MSYMRGKSLEIDRGDGYFYALRFNHSEHSAPSANFANVRTVSFTKTGSNCAAICEKSELVNASLSILGMGVSTNGAVWFWYY